MNRFSDELKGKPFKDYEEFMSFLFGAVNTCLDGYIAALKLVFKQEQGGYKSVIYPDLEIAHDVCHDKLQAFNLGKGSEAGGSGLDADPGQSQEDEEEALGEDLMNLLGAFAQQDSDSSDFLTSSEDDAEEASVQKMVSGEKLIRHIIDRAELALAEGVSIPFYALCKRQKFDPFTIFCFASAIMSSTQTDYAGVFQVVNENANLSAPTIESAAKLYYGDEFTATAAYADMSACLEQLSPIMDLHVNGNMPFSTVVSPDKRVIDHLFGRDPMKLDENYSRFISMITDDKELDPILANSGIMEAMEISYGEGVRIFAYYGDEGSGRKFFVKHFCKKNQLSAISIDCKKLFVYDYSYVDKALWAVTRECILTESCCVLDELTYREEEKDKFQGYMDLAFGRLTARDLLVFCISKEDIKMKDITRRPFTDFPFPTPSNTERLECWKYYSRNFKLADDIDHLEMTTKFLFTPGKVYGALKSARSLAAMAKEEEITREKLFKGCYAQMSSELSQKATRVEAKYGFEDIVMNKAQRETVQHAIDQMLNKKQVYEDWNYEKKYAYGKGLTVLLFGAPGTGKTMMAQVIAHELNLELYRVDISKVVDKYVGETEKSLSMIFREAKKCNVVLFFDECDTLFAKRTDDGGSNQSSNNNKTALLLQEMEAYDGVCVLATNYKHNIDPAFFRRMKYIVEFQFPDVETRKILWTTTIPKTTPLGRDVDIDFLAEKFEFVGGNIKNIILNAAFLAAADETNTGHEVCMRHYLNAVKYEFIKVGKVYTKADFEPYSDMVGL